MAVYFNSEINRRSSNEDSYCDLKLRINHEASVHIMSVADGMGGLSAGKYYSRAAVRLLNEKLLHLIMDDSFRGSSLDEQTELLTQFCRKVFQEINHELYTGGLNAGVKGGTTLSLVIRFWHRYIIANCGDSPVYYMKDGNLHLACDIQNAAWHMVLEGRAKEGSLLYYQNKSRLLQYLGRREAVTPHLLVLEEDKADCILLGTDGVFGNLTNDQIARILVQEKNGQEALKALFEYARDGGEEDNQTAILYVRDSGRPNKGIVKESEAVKKEMAKGLDMTKGEEEAGNLSLKEVEVTQNEDLYSKESVVSGSYRSVSTRTGVLWSLLLRRHKSGGKKK